MSRTADPRHPVLEESPPFGRAPLGEPRTPLKRALLLIAGIVATQAILYAPSLAGRKILLPLDILKLPKYYLPVTPETRGYVAENGTLVDEIISIDLRRRYAAREVRSGRLPLWNPLNYCGAPFIAANNTAVFSPFRLPDYLFPSPVAIAWVQLLKSLVGGVGAYLFFRRALRVSFWPAAVGAWCFPLIGFLILWRGYPPSFVAVWLPWVLLATDATVRRPGGPGGIGLALATAALLVSGHAGVAAHVLLTSALYAPVALIDRFGLGRLASVASLRAMLALGAGWGIGFLLSAPQNLPTIEYLRHSRRVARRESGRVEFPSVGPAALPLLVLPYFYGSWQRGSLYIAPGGQYTQGIYHAPNARSEEAATGYAGLLMALFAAPLALASRRHRVLCIGWLVIGGFALSHTLGVPGVAPLFRFFPLRLLQNNRFVFVTAFSVISLGVIGLELLAHHKIERLSWFLLPAIAVAALGAWCLYRAVVLPEPIAKLSRSAVVPKQAAMAIQLRFVGTYFLSALWCGVATAAWAVFLRPRWFRAWMPAALAAAMVGEMIYNAHGVSPQVDWSLNYPKLPILETLASAAPGRICGWDCLPACLNQTHDLRDIRGYDGAGPRRLMELFERCELWVDGHRVENHNTHGSQWFIPPLGEPILDMLNLRYVIYRGVPPPDAKPRWVGLDYWVRENPHCLPRVYIPARSEVETDSQRTLDRLSEASFNPRQLALVAEAVDLPTGTALGEASIVEESPSLVAIDVKMETPGLVVLADQWYPGWKATYDGRELPVWRTNHALRGVLVPAGTGRLVFQYVSRPFQIGVLLMIASVGVLAVWGMLAWRAARKSESLRDRQRESRAG